MKSKKDELKKDFEELIQMATNLKIQINKIKLYKEFDRFDVTEIAKESGRIRILRQTAKELDDFVAFPERVRDVGRPVKYPDSQQEKELLTGYVKEGLSIRKIAQKTGISKDVISGKINRYGIK